VALHHLHKSLPFFLKTACRRQSILPAYHFKRVEHLLFQTRWLTIRMHFHPGQKNSHASNSAGKGFNAAPLHL